MPLGYDIWMLDAHGGEKFFAFKQHAKDAMELISIARREDPSCKFTLRPSTGDSLRHNMNALGNLLKKFGILPTEER